jgi:flagellar hook-associated protein 1 FlgK
MGSLLGIGVSAISTAQLNLLTTEHNISNVNTRGFHRQEAIQGANAPLSTGAGFIGSGSHVQTVRRMYGQFLDDQVSSASAQAQFYDTYHGEIKQIDDLLADPNTGLSPAVQSFFTSVNSVANSPTSVAARQSMLSGGETLAARFQSLYSRFDEIRSGINTQLDTQVTGINSYAAQVADLNQKIIDAQSINNQPPNDLLDQRDQIVAKLNEMVKTTVVRQTDGTYNLFIGSGQSLVTGSTAYSLALQNDPNDSSQKNVAYVIGGSYIPIPSASLQNGGSLGGLLAFRSNSLDAAQNALGRVALGVAQTVNNQNRLGQDLNGVLGGNFFSIASTSPTILNNSNNTGGATLSGTLTGNSGTLTASNYQVLYNGANYSITDSATNTTTSGLSSAQLVTQLSNVGVTLAISGAPSAGDQWLILPTRYGARDISVGITDPNKIAAAAPIRAAATTSNTGGATIDPGSVNTTTQPPLNANLQNQVSITFTSATTFNVSDVTLGSTLATGVAYTSGSAISYNGWTVHINGTPATGDAFTVATNTGGIGDNRNAVALAALQNNNSLANNSAGTPTTSYQGAYAQLVSSVGNTTRQMQVSNTAQQTLLDNATQTQQQLSGVNLDEEAANLLRFQQAYQAAAKMIQMGSTLFDTILAIR